MKLIEEFINNCVKNNISSISNICKAAQDEVNLLQTEVNALEIQKLQKESKIKELSLFIKQMSNTTQSENYKITNVDFDNLNAHLKKMILQILNIFENNKTVSSTELINKFGIKDQKVIYSSIKWLWDSNIIDRSENASFKQGKEWGTRPKVLAEII